MKLTLWLPLIYVVGGFGLLFAFGGAGHGWGIEVFYYVSLPASLLIQGGKWAMLWVLLAGAAQYALIGYVVDRFWKNR